MMLIAFFESNHEFLPESQTVNAEFYKEVFKHLLQPIWWFDQKWTGVDSGISSMTTAIHVSNFLAQHKVTVLQNPPYFPDMAPTDFFLFPYLKLALKCLRFTDVAEVQQCVTTGFQAIPNKAFADTFQHLYKLYQKCVVDNGDYFEGQ